MNAIHAASAAIIAALAVANCSTSSRLDRLKAETAQASAARTEAARLAEASHRARERAAADTIANITQEAENEKAALRRRAAALADSLRNRHDRPAGSDVPTGPADPMACTGAGHYRSDAEFLVGEAARADQLRADLATCQAAYDAAVKLTQ